MESTPQVRKGSIQYYVSIVASNLDKLESQSFYIAIKNLQNYCRIQGSATKDTSNQQYKIDEVLGEFSTQGAKDPLLYVILSYSILDIPMGDKAYKANRISRDIQTMKPDPRPIVWEYYEKIFKWVLKTVKTSTNLIVQPIIDNVFQWIADSNVEHKIAGCRLMKILIQHHPEVESSWTLCAVILFNCYKMEKPELWDVSDKALKALIINADDKVHSELVRIVNQVISMKQIEHYEGVSRVIQVILDVSQEFPGTIIRFPKFTEVPFSSLDSKDPREKMGALSMLPVALSCNHAIFIPDIFVQIFKSYEVLVRKKSPGRNEALLSLGKLCMRKTSDWVESELTAIKKVRQEVYEAIDSPEAAYAAIALQVMQPKQFEKEAQAIYSFIGSPLVIDALKDFIGRFPYEADAIYRHALLLINSVLLALSSPQEQLLNMFSALSTLTFPSGLFSVPLILEYTAHLRSRVKALRFSCARFVVAFQQHTPHIEILLKLLDTVATEMDTEIRDYIMQNTRFEPVDNSIVMGLQSLLHDKTPSVRLEALRRLTLMADYPAAMPVVSSLISEKVVVLRHADQIPGESIESFLMVSSAAFSDPSKPYAPAAAHVLVPFAQFLIKHLISYKRRLSASSLQLLAQLLPLAPEGTNIEQLAAHIGTSLVTHSSRHRLDAVLDLFDSAIDHTELRFQLEGKLSWLISKLLVLAKLSHESVDREKLARIFGKIGALKPEIIHNLITEAGPVDTTNNCSANQYIAGAASSDPYKALVSASIGVGLINIIDILGDESLSTLHPIAIESLLTFLKAIRQMSDDLEELLMMRIKMLITSGGSSTQSTLLANMPTLIAVLGDRFKPLVPHVVDLVHKKWGSSDTVMQQLTRTCEWMKYQIKEAFIPYLPDIAQLFVRDFGSLPPKNVDVIMSCFVSFGQDVSRVDHIIMPAILEWITCNSDETTSCLQVIVRLKTIIENAGCTKFATPILRTMIRVTQSNKALHNKCMDLVMVVAVQARQQFLIQLQDLYEVFNFKDNMRYQLTVNCIEIGADPPPLDKPQNAKKPKPEAKTTRAQPTSFDMPDEPPKIPPLPASDKHALDESAWITWYNELFNVVVRQSSSRAISVCAVLAERHQPVHESIFPIAFTLVYLQYRSKKLESLNTIIKGVFKSDSTPRYILRRFLSVLELIEVLGLECPIPMILVNHRSQGANNIAQALRAAEKLYDEGQESVTLDLVVLNQQLGLPLAANGILRCNQQRCSINALGELSERLGLWDDALENYQGKLEADPKNERLICGKLNCLNELLRYEELKEAAVDPQHWLYKAAATWGLFEEKQFEEVARHIDEDADEPMAHFYRAFYYITHSDYATAQRIIEEIRLSKIPSVFPMIFEDYERAFGDTAMLSILAELEEVIQFKKAKDQAAQSIPAKKMAADQEMQRIKRGWDMRFKMLPHQPDILFKHLRVRSLVLGFEEMKDNWLEMIDSALATEHYSIAASTIAHLQKEAPEDENLLFESARLLYHMDDKQEATRILTELTKRKGPIAGPAYLRKGEWFALDGKYEEARQEMKNALETLQSNGSAWNSWSLVNLELAEKTNNQSYVIDAAEGSLNGLYLSSKDPLVFTLRFLTILFRRGSKELYQLFKKRMSSIPVHVWIDVLPQIIARSNSEDEDLREIITEILNAVGNEHPHVLLYSLMVPLKGEASERQRIAASIFDHLRTRYPDIVESIIIFANELIRVAVTWWEMAYTTLDEAANAYLKRNDIPEMLNQVMSIHQKISRKPQTYYEVAFLTEFGNSLANAETWIRKYNETKDEECVLQAWQIYHGIYKSVRGIVEKMTKIPLKDASPPLAGFRDLPLAVPGSYQYGTPLVTVSRISPELKVMMSKQRPRRMGIIGSDAFEYTFLLKAHEDTRLDERVMQLFGFINSLVEHSTIPMKSKLTITTYKVIPLTGEVGLIGWVPECDTLLGLIKAHREKQGIQFNVEHLTIMKAAPNYDSLPLNDKVFAFKRGLKTTAADDLKVLMLENADDSNHWIERRNAYSTSLAMTSMAGYILGLGDRHLCNIMIKKRSAKLVHIDFGDCFEVAMHREKFPEKVPFRLTRILTNALEVSKIEGTFRSCCENTMGLMRANSEQINGLLEVFVYDPLSQWAEGEGAMNGEAAISRIRDKLSGRDFPGERLGVNVQVDRLIKEATDVNNLCQMYSGWYPTW